MTLKIRKSTTLENLTYEWRKFHINTRLVLNRKVGQEVEGEEDLPALWRPTLFKNSL